MIYGSLRAQVAIVPRANHILLFSGVSGGSPTVHHLSLVALEIHRKLLRLVVGYEFAFAWRTAALRWPRFVEYF